MSAIKKIGEYLKVVKAGIENGDKVIESIYVATQVKNGTASEEAVAEIMRRKDICNACPYNSRNAVASKIYTTNLDFEHCIFCLCRIGGSDTKEYCLSCKCGISVFNDKNPDKQMPIKWEAFDNNKKEQ